MLPRGVVGSLVVATIAIVYLQEAIKLPIGSVNTPGMGFVPVLFGTVLLILCVILAGVELLAPRPGRGDMKESVSNLDKIKGNDLKRMLGFILSLLLYPIALSCLGFIFATIALLFVSLRIMNYKNWIYSLMAAVVATLAAQFLFVNLLGVSFLTGILIF